MTKNLVKKALMVSILVSVLAVSGTAMAWDYWVWMGDYVWADADCDGVQNEGPEAGLNWIKVLFWRDYDCNGFVDGYDELFDYDFTHDDALGNPGYYEVPSDAGFCFVVELDATTIPDGLHVTTDEELSVKLNGADYWDADFGLGACDETPEFACPKTIGFWKQQILQTSAKKFTLAEVNSIIAEALTLTPVFTSAADLKTALLSNGTAGALQRARRQFAGFVLNFAAYNLDGSLGYSAGLSDLQPLNLPGLTYAGWVGEAFDEVEGYILSGTNLDKANNIADAINNGNGIDVNCPIDLQSFASKKFGGYPVVRLNLQSR